MKIKKIIWYILLIGVISLIVNVLYYQFGEKGIPGRPLDSNLTMEEWKDEQSRK